MRIAAILKRAARAVGRAAVARQSRPFRAAMVQLVMAGVALAALAMLAYIPSGLWLGLLGLAFGIAAWGAEAARPVLESAPWWAWITMILIWGFARGLSNDHSAVLRQNAYLIERVAELQRDVDGLRARINPTADDHRRALRGALRDE